MISNSKRLKTQLYFEELLGCSDPSDLKSFQDSVKNIRLGLDTSRKFQIYCEGDCKSFILKGTISLLSAINELHNGRQTWPVVQLYYSIYYFLRAEVLMKYRCILRANQVFTVRCRNGEFIEKVPNKGAKSDHALTIYFARKYLSETDILQSQSVNGEFSYDWMMKRRDWYQYKKSDYIEADDSGPFLSFEHISLFDQVTMYLADSDPYFCFDPDYATLALPVKRFQFTISNAKDAGIMLESKHLKLLQSLGTSTKSSAELFRQFAS